MGVPVSIFFRNPHLRENLARDCCTSTASTVNNSVQNIFTRLRYCDKQTVATFNNNLVQFIGAGLFVVENLTMFNQTSEISARLAYLKGMLFGLQMGLQKYYMPERSH